MREVVGSSPTATTTNSLDLQLNFDSSTDRPFDDTMVLRLFGTDASITKKQVTSWALVRPYRKLNCPPAAFVGVTRTDQGEKSGASCHICPDFLFREPVSNVSSLPKLFDYNQFK